MTDVFEEIISWTVREAAHPADSPGPDHPTPEGP
jgi:hypothetical protein